MCDSNYFYMNMKRSIYQQYQQYTHHHRLNWKTYHWTYYPDIGVGSIQISTYNNDHLRSIGFNIALFQAQKTSFRICHFAYLTQLQQVSLVDLTIQSTKTFGHTYITQVKYKVLYNKWKRELLQMTIFSALFSKNILFYFTVIQFICTRMISHAEYNKTLIFSSIIIQRAGRMCKWGERKKKLVVKTIFYWSVVIYKKNVEDLYRTLKKKKKTHLLQESVSFRY